MINDVTPYVKHVAKQFTQRQLEAISDEYFDFNTSITPEDLENAIDLGQSAHNICVVYMKKYKTAYYFINSDDDTDYADSWEDLVERLENILKAFKEDK